ERVDMVERIEANPAGTQCCVVAEAQRGEAVGGLMQGHRENDGQNPGGRRSDDLRKLAVDDHATSARVKVSKCASAARRSKSRREGGRNSSPRARRAFAAAVSGMADDAASRISSSLPLQCRTASQPAASAAVPRAAKLPPSAPMPISSDTRKPSKPIEPRIT